MSFKIVENPQFTHDVEVNVPVDGGFEKQKLATCFRALNIDEMQKFELGEVKSQTEFVDKIVIGFEDLVDSVGNAMVCTPDLRRKLLSLPYIRVAVMAQYQSALAGMERKN